MKKNIKYIIIFLIIILMMIIILLIKPNKENVVTSGENINIVQEEIQEKEENALVVSIGKQEEQPQEPEEKEETPQPQPEPEKDAATLTQEIYDMNSPIGTLYIPKTGLKTEIYSSVIVEQMEKMPCFLYTTGGLNKTGVTLFVGHNRRNGKLFSNNKKLEEGDEFYFTDYKGKEMKYTIYSKFTTTEDDVSFLNNNVDAPTIALSCCTDASDENRIIILGRAD